MITERRQYPRKTPLEFTFIQLEQEFAGHVLNYSREGLSFETTAPVNDSDLVQFWLSFRQHGQIDGVGRITWLNEKKNRGGIAFVHLSRTSREKVDEWTAAPADIVASVEHNPDDEESPEKIVSKIMEQVLTEKRHSPAVAVHSGKDADGKDAAGATTTLAQEAQQADSPASALLTPPDTMEGVGVTESHTAEPPESCTAVAEPTIAAPAIAATSDEPPGLLQADAAATVEPHEPEPTENAHAVATVVFAPARVETGDLWSTSGTLAPEGWDASSTPAFNPEATPAFDSSVRNAVDATPSPASSLVTEQIHGAAANLESELPPAPFRKWPGSSSPVYATPPAEESQDTSLRISPQEGMSELVPLKHYVYARRSQFLRGAAIGIMLSLVIAISAFEFWKPARQVPRSDDPRKVVAANSTVASGATIPEPAPPAALVPESKGSESSQQKGQSVFSPRKSAVAQKDLATPGQPSRTSGITPGHAAPPASAQDSANVPTNAIPKPSSFAYRTSTSASGPQPLFNLSQPGNSDGPTPNEEPENAQPGVAIDLRSTPWSFHRKNIHGTPPVGGEVRPAELISSVAPHYPQAARARQISGEVVIEAIIDARGNVRKPKVVSGPTLLRSAAVNAVLGWKYKPALLDGKPTEVRETITVKFLPQ